MYWLLSFMVFRGSFGFLSLFEFENCPGVWLRIGRRDRRAMITPLTQAARRERDRILREDAHETGKANG